MERIEFRFYEENETIPKIGLSANVESAFTNGKWQVSGEGFTGQGESRNAALLDWLASQLCPR